MSSTISGLLPCSWSLTGTPAHSASAQRLDVSGPTFASHSPACQEPQHRSLPSVARDLNRRRRTSASIATRLASCGVARRRVQAHESAFRRPGPSPDPDVPSRFEPLAERTPRRWTPRRDSLIPRDPLSSHPAAPPRIYHACGPSLQDRRFLLSRLYADDEVPPIPRARSTSACGRASCCHSLTHAQSLRLCRKAWHPRVATTTRTSVRQNSAQLVARAEHGPCRSAHIPERRPARARAVPPRAVPRPQRKLELSPPELVDSPASRHPLVPLGG